MVEALAVEFVEDRVQQDGLFVDGYHGVGGD